MRTEILTRREFALSLGCLALRLRAAEGPQVEGPWSEPAVVHKVYLSGTELHWPKPTLDVQQEVKEVEARLAEVEQKHRGRVRFVGGELLRTREDVEAWARKLGDADAVLVTYVSFPSPLGELLEAVKLPVLVLALPYAGHHWASIAQRRKTRAKLDVVASSSYGDLDPYMGIFRTIRHLRKSKVLVVSMRPQNLEKLAAGFSERYGTTIKFLTYDDLHEAFRAADRERARREARELVAGALRVVEPKPQEIEDAVRYYHGVCEILRREQANAMTVDCFGGLLARKMPAYPCIAWSKLNDLGLYGVCEADLRSTMTQLLVTSYSGMPGFVSDPVFDTSRNEVIHAHCVSATRMQGIHGPASPYILRSHLETNDGVVMQVLMPAGETITCAEFRDPGTMLVSTGEVTAAEDSDRGCRTKIRTRVKDAEKWLQSYQAGLHRVIFYGDHVGVLEKMGRLLGFEVIHEM
ncbi:MAG: hypothetical protein RMI94_05725 [Bryobacterales bacterium]|nr:hypothetical protein [Bryobacteraceae bacterium]MDW8130029.1 hypothetical protein [Bryobacterales bacterium]